MEKIHLVKVCSWKWGKTEDESGKQFYDCTDTGKVFFSSSACPFCESPNGLKFTTNYIAEIIEWCCLSCGKQDIVAGRYGEGTLLPCKDKDEHIVLPEYLVIILPEHKSLELF